MRKRLKKKLMQRGICTHCKGLFVFNYDLFSHVTCRCGGWHKKDNKYYKI